MAPVLLQLSVVVLGLMAIMLIGVGVGLAVRQLVFLTQAYRVPGTVVNEWRYRMYGHRQRYYRVAFQLRNGQHAQLRGTGSRALGTAVPVLVRERPGCAPKATIAAWTRLWWPSILALGLGAVCASMFASLLSALPG